MRIVKAWGTNFQSYAEVEFDYTDLGLALIAGQTGSGKSTLLDLPAWVLFGTTSKDSAADDVKSWFAEDAATVGTVRVETPEGTIFVTRIRGKRPSENDLHWVETLGADPIRGKDAIDTQKLIEAKLGTTADLYFAGSYMGQFSKVDQFFIAKAKERRETLERVADVSLAAMLAERASDARKTAKKDLDAKTQAKARLDGKLESAVLNVTKVEQGAATWETAQAGKIKTLEAKRDNFAADQEARITKSLEQVKLLEKTIVDPTDFDARGVQYRTQLKQMENLERDLVNARTEVSTAASRIATLKSEYQRLTSLGDVCPTCLGPACNPNLNVRLGEIETELGRVLEAQDKADAHRKEIVKALEAKPKLTEGYQKLVGLKSDNQRLIDKRDGELLKVKVIRAERNPYLDEIEGAVTETNPFVAQRERAEAEVASLKAETAKAGKEVVDLERRVSALTWLYDKSFELRGSLLEQAVRQIQDATNAYLDRYFDAVIRVTFALKDSDKLEVSIAREGYDCPYRQLSGGERALLKLAFAVSYMRAAENMAGIKFNCLMLDEAMNGLDAGLKVKAFGLLQSLENEYESILLIDHEEQFKQMFSKKFLVSRTGSTSQIEAIE